MYVGYRFDTSAWDNQFKGNSEKRAVNQIVIIEDISKIYFFISLYNLKNNIIYYILYIVFYNYLYFNCKYFKKY